MTPASHTLYTLTLFLALATLNLWSNRRHRIPILLPARAPRTLPGNAPSR